MSYVWGRAYNRLTGESMIKPEFPRIMAFDHMSEWYKAYYAYVSDMKKWDAFIAEIPDTYRYERPKLVHAKVKGIPVPRTGSRRWHSGKNSGKSGVIGNSRVLPHRYMDEGDKGAAHNRHIKRVERAQWLSEALEELREQEDAYSVSDWYGGVFGQDDADAWYDYDTEEYECEYCQGPCEL